MKSHKVTIKDAKPQVGIFEIVEGQMLIDAEDTQTKWPSAFFDGEILHRYDQDIKRLVKHNSYISPETKVKFETNPNEYFNWPRGRVDYDTTNGTWNIMSSRRVLEDGGLVERITRAFHLPSYLSGKIELVADDGHYS